MASGLHQTAADYTGISTQYGGSRRVTARSAVGDGLNLEDLRPGSTLRVTTQHTCYVIRMLLGRMALISGHPVYCPQPVLVTLQGPTKEVAGPKGVIGRGLPLKFHHPEHGTTIITSAIKEIRECPAIDHWTIASIVSI